MKYPQEQFVPAIITYEITALHSSPYFNLLNLARPKKCSLSFYKET